MDYKNIIELWDRFEQSNTTEFDLDFQGAHLSLKKAVQAAPTAYTTPAVNQIEIQQTASKKEESAQSQMTQPETQPEATQQEAASTKTIKAPLVGTFYRAPSPEEAPFVEVGQSIKKGDVIGIIEAMKLMNEVTATEDGIITEIPAEDATLVGFDDVLIRLQ